MRKRDALIKERPELRAYQEELDRILENTLPEDRLEVLNILIGKQLQRLTTEINKIQETVKTVDKDEFVRCFEPEEETFRKVPTGNKVLNKHCTFCDFKNTCWTNLQEHPQAKSKAKFPKMVQYIEYNAEQAS